ncbi:hypothetical protein ABL78_7247 [Leptomonas seymouri]|uniref:WD repeat protein mio zinc-ribbon like domain-containing protein n=1 Tax=Leptomonas seymouri TaxID=5684 RepID=A0A0N1I0X1_LEPSE|nr:hypothetical protein ABL78_7247 [Leptomonas seymouri]|eukprot:KPI83715.1 hypothetical protein ABL78_7247 [Leptomonas seymouri]
MKCFSCQPDSHNGFGSLTNGVLTYFTVDCARYKRLSRASGGAERGESGVATSEGPRATAGAHSTTMNSQGVGSDAVFSPPMPSAKPSASAAFYSEAYHESHFSIDTRMHIQRTLTLPSAFQATQCCFSMANRTVFGTDMAFIGAANGLLALVVLHEDLLLYVHGKDPQSLRDQLQRGRRGGAATTAASSYSPPSAALAPSATTATHLSTGAEAAPSHTLSLGQAIASTGTSAGAPSLSLAFSLTNGSSSPPHIAGVPSTITWMRDKPLVLVGYTTGRIEWYRVSLSPAHRQALIDPSKELPFGASMASGAFAYQALNRDAHTSRVARVVVGGGSDGLQTEMVASCHLPDAGALITSDYFPANGTVAVGGERGGLYLFHTDRLEAPLCELNLSARAAGFLYCHPFLPLIGIVSSAVWAQTDTARRRRLPQSQSQQQLPQSLDSPTRATSPTSLRKEHVNMKDEKDHLRCLRSSPLSRGDRCSPQEISLIPSTTAAEAARTDRHVGWCDESMAGASALRGVAAAPRAPVASSGFRSSSLASGEAMRSGCVISLVEYAKEAPPQLLVRSWAGDQPLAPTHRLTQVLQHWMESANPRYSTSYNFSWKFSFDLELVVGNVEEGALRVVRISRVAASAPVDPFTSLQGYRGRVDGNPGADSIVDSASNTGVERESSVGGSYVATGGGGGSCGSHFDAYRVTQEYSVRLPLHSPVNVEYVSAATSALSVLDTSTMGRGGGGVEGVEQRGPMTAFQREAERRSRHSALLSMAAQAAAHRRSRLGFSVNAAGLLCHPSSAFWAGLAVVSLPHHRRHLTAAAEAEARRSCRSAGGGNGGPGGARNIVDGDAGGPQLKENALAVAMLQPLRGEYSGVDNTRRHHRHGAGTGSSLHAGTDGVSSSRLQSSLSASTHQRRRRRDRDPLAPAITLPSYAARTTQNEIANAVLIAADHRVDLHQRLRVGAGSVSCVVGMNAAGEVASVPIEVRAVATWHEEGSIFVGLGPTTCAADLVSIQGIERVMRWRHGAGFGISAEANVEAARKVGGYGSEDVVLLFSYVAMLERVGVVSSTGSVPSLIELLRGSAGRSRCIPADARKSQLRLTPRLQAAMKGSVFHGDLHRLLALQVLGWLPPSLAEEWVASAAAAHAPTTPEWLRLPFEASPVLCEANTNTDIERAAAIEVSHARYDKAAELLLRFARRSPSYRAVAILLKRPADALAMVQDSDERVCAAFRASLTPWLLVVFHCVCSCAEKQQHVFSTSTGTGIPSHPLSTALPRELYLHSSLFLWDRVALAIVMEDGPSGALDHVLRDVLLPPCNPLQALLLHHGVHRRTVPSMQEIVDCTGDFQLGACLFARVGVLTTAAALAFPFLLDGVVQSSTASTAEGSSSDTSAMHLPLCMPGGCSSRDVLVSPGHPFREVPLGWRGDGDSCAEDGVKAETGEDGVRGSYNADGDTGIHYGSDASSSPYAYLYGSTSEDSSRRAIPHAMSADPQRGAFDGSVSHTTRLVRNSALPPPLLPSSSLLAHGASSRTYASSLHASPLQPPPQKGGNASGAVCSHQRAPIDSTTAANAAISSTTESTRTMGEGSWATLYSKGNCGNDTSAKADDADTDAQSDAFGDGEGELMDEPWVWWAAAYRSFLDDEQAFVRRTTFDVECQQLCIQAATHAAALLPKGRPRSAGAGSGGASGAVPRVHALSCCRYPSLRELDGAGHRLVYSPVGDRLANTTAYHTGIRLSHFDNSAAQTPLPVSLPFLCSSAGAGTAARDYGLRSSISHAELIMGAHTMDSGTSTGGTTAQECVCGELHEGTQLIRSLLNLCSTTTTRCSVCLEPVRLGSCDVSSAFAWCTSCRHGGHSRHLQEWFLTHRRCPIDGCDCHCDEDSSLF